MLFLYFMDNAYGRLLGWSIKSKCCKYLIHDLNIFILIHTFIDTYNAFFVIIFLWLHSMFLYLFLIPYTHLPYLWFICQKKSLVYYPYNYLHFRYELSTIFMDTKLNMIWNFIYIYVCDFQPPWMIDFLNNRRYNLVYS